MFSADYERALRAIRHVMPPCLRSRFDPEDFVQDACVDMIARGEDPAWLKRIAKDRMIDAFRFSRTQKRTPKPKPTTEPPTPHELIVIDEMIDGFVSRAGSLARDYIGSLELRRVVIAMACRGYSAAEIAEQTGCHRRCVYAFLQAFRRQYSP